MGEANNDIITEISIGLRLDEKNPKLFSYCQDLLHTRKYNYYIFSEIILTSYQTKDFLSKYWYNMTYDLESEIYNELDYNLVLLFNLGHSVTKTLDDSKKDSKRYLLKQTNYLCKEICLFDNCKNCKLNDLRRNLQKI